VAKFPQKNDFAVHDFAKLPAPPLHFRRLAQGLLCVTCATHFADRDFAKKSHFLLSFFEHFPIIPL